MVEHAAGIRESQRSGSFLALPSVCLNYLKNTRNKDQSLQLFILLLFVAEQVVAEAVPHFSFIFDPTSVRRHTQMLNPLQSQIFIIFVNIKSCTCRKYLSKYSAYGQMQ